MYTRQSTHRAGKLLHTALQETWAQHKASTVGAAAPSLGRRQYGCQPHTEKLTTLRIGHRFGNAIWPCALPNRCRALPVAEPQLASQQAGQQALSLT